MAVLYLKAFGLDKIIDVVDAVSKPSFKTIGALDKVLKLAFDDTQAKVHAPGNPGSPTYVPTGSLKNSGNVESDFDGKVWAGTITYGGSSSGFPNDPVEYAIYEAARGGEHDFFRDLPEFEDAFVHAMGEAQFGGV